MSLPGRREPSCPFDGFPPYLLTAVPVASETAKTGSAGMAHCPLSQVTARGVLPPALIGARASDGDMRPDR